MTTMAQDPVGAGEIDTDDNTVAAEQQREPFGLLPWLMSFGGALGLLAALDLNIERGKLLEDPNYITSCSFNPVVDCGVVATSPQASVFGFSNTLLGVVAFSVVLTLGVLLLLGSRLPRGAWLGLNAGLALGVGFVHWLITQSVFQIGVLCPYCIVVWSVTIPLFWYVTLRNLSAGAFGAAAARSSVVRTLRSVHAIPVVLWFVVVATLIGVHFADAWANLL